MGRIYAELIGDPVEHSKSPLIYKFWLDRLGVDADYRLRRCRRGEVAAYLRERCADPFWRGCNVTAPLKAEAAAAAVDPTGVCARIGAANALFRSPLGCAVGANTDVAGIAAALHGIESVGRVCLIGAGGAARAALEVLRVRGASQVSLIARDPGKARAVQAGFGMAGGVHAFDEAAGAMTGADCVINATPLGTDGCPPMPQAVLDALAETGDRALILDMVYAPVETALLRRARELGRSTADGLVMLVGQAAPAFELFFGRPPPRAHDDELRGLLTS